MCRQGIRRRLRQETRGSEGNLCPLTTQLSKYSPVRLRGGYFFTLSYPSIVQIFYWLPIIWITHLNYPVQLDYANTHPFRYRGGVTFLFSLIRPLCKSLLASYYLDYPFQPDYAKFPRANAGEFCILFSPSAGVLYIFFYFHYTETLGDFRSYQLPKTI